MASLLLCTARNPPFSPPPSTTSLTYRRPSHPQKYSAGAKLCPRAPLFYSSSSHGRSILSAPAPSTRHGPCMALNSGRSTSTEEVAVERTATVQPTSDAQCASWVDMYLPESVRPYADLARVSKPIGTLLFAWPILWSVAMATAQGVLPDLKTMALFGIESFFIQSLACTINDFFDRDIDKKVERSKNRPLAAGVVTPFQALCFVGFQLLLSLGVLLQVNPICSILGVPYVFLIFTYPLMKRMTHWPGAYLGLATTWGTLLGWAAIKESFDFSIIIPLYIGGLCWTIVYDTIYGHQDKEDDIKVGVKSLALKFGSQTKYWITGFGAACIGGLALGGYNAKLAWPYYAFLIAAAGQIAWQILTVDLSNPKDCNKKFLSNQWFGAIVFCGILLGRFISQGIP